MVHSSSSSGIFFEGDEQSQALRNQHLASFGNSNLIPRNMYPNMIPVSGDVNNAVMDSMASSLVTDDNSGLSGGTPCLKRSASINTESYVRLPASPLSFSSNNISISGSSTIDVQSPVHRQGFHQGASTATSLPNPRIGFISDHDNVSNLQKKPRIDIKQEDNILQQQTLRQMLQRQDSMQLQALYQQQQLLQSLPPVQRAHLLQQQQQSRQNYQQPGLQTVSAVNRTNDGGVCSRRLMQYLFHQRNRPADITYWRKFVAEYYSPRAKKRWCLAVHNNVGHHPLGVFPPANMDVWQCGICGSKSGRGFEASYEVLPRLNEIKFGSGVIDELWFLDLPRECRFPSGIMMLEYGKAVQESVYEQLRVVHEGRLKVIFTPDLKILTWEFCSRRHEELLPRRLLAPQVNQLVEVAQKWQSKIAESGSGGVSQQDLQTSSNMFVTAGRQLAKSLELPPLNDLGFTKRYVRCLQIAEVVNSMKDLMDFTQVTNAGPVDALKSFPRKTSVPKLQMPVLNSSMNNNNNNNIHMGNRGAPLGYHNMLTRQQDATSSFNNSIQNRSPFQSQALQSNATVGGFSSLQQQHLPYQRFPSGIFQQNQQQQQQPPPQQPQQQLISQGGSEAVQVQQHVIQQVVKGMNDNSNGGAKPSISGQSGGGPTRSNSFKGGSHSDSCAPDLPHVSDIFQDIGSEFMEDGFFNFDA